MNWSIKPPCVEYLFWLLQFRCQTNHFIDYICNQRSPRYSFPLLPTPRRRVSRWFAREICWMVKNISTKSFVISFFLSLKEFLDWDLQVNSQFSMMTWWLFVLVSVVEEFNMSIFLGFKLIDWRNLDWICLIFLATCFQAHGGKDPFMIGIERRSSPKRRFVDGPCMRDMISEKMF